MALGQATDPTPWAFAACVLPVGDWNANPEQYCYHFRQSSRLTVFHGQSGKPHPTLHIGAPMKKIFAALALTASCVALTACNKMEEKPAVVIDSAKPKKDTVVVVKKDTVLVPKVDSAAAAAAKKDSSIKAAKAILENEKKDAAIAAAKKDSTLKAAKAMVDSAAKKGDGKTAAPKRATRNSGHQ
jgi:hypothetical protein